TGYIAGGTIAGVLIAFLNFSEDLPKKLSIWQYSRYQLSQERSLDEAYQEAAKSDFGLVGPTIPTEREQDGKELNGGSQDLNWGLVQQYVMVPKGTLLKLPPIDIGLDVTQLPEQAKAPGDDTSYHVWRASEGNTQGVPVGKYLVDNQGRLRYYEVEQAAYLKD